VNDTKATILIQGRVVGDTVTFSLFGTRDDRSAKIDGPHTLSTTPAGDPIYIESDTLKIGEKKQVEKAHPGGSAVATYTITYPDGTEKKQVFKSAYRNWPAQYLVGRDPSKVFDPATGTYTEATSTTPTEPPAPAATSTLPVN
jgi:hypothetical protein